MTNQDYKYLSSWDPSDKNAVCPSVQVVTCFLQKKDKFLVLQRARKDLQHNLWGIPGGKLDEGETPLVGLVREIKEETGVMVTPESFLLMGTARSKTPCDGEYGLYLYHAVVPEDTSICINRSEHHSFLWVSPEEFETLSLLTAQREAYLSVRGQVYGFFKSNIGMPCETKITK